MTQNLPETIFGWPQIVGNPEDAGQFVFKVNHRAQRGIRSREVVERAAEQIEQRGVRVLRFHGSLQELPTIAG